MQEANAATGLTIEAVNKWYPGGVHAVIDMNMEVQAGEFLVFVGPSGCGKTTLLRMIAGLESISGGTVSMGERIINQVPPKSRDIAMVFQNYALYPTMRVKENIAFPLKMRKTPRPELNERVDQVARKLELTQLLERRPGELSGGQRQRVALARAMVRKPRLFLMDEPLSNLDAKLRTEMRREIVSLQRELGVTTIYVTHDQTEAMTMGTRIAVINGGRLQQIGTPMEIYDNPQNLFVAGFIGSPNMNTWDSEVVYQSCGFCLSLGQEVLPIRDTGAEGWQARKLVAAIRPEHIALARPEEEGTFWMEVAGVEHMGRESVVFLSRTGYPNLTMVTGPGWQAAPGKLVPVALDTRFLHGFDPESGVRIQ